MQIKELSTRYSEFISFPIEVWAEKTSYDQVPDTSVEVEEGEEPKMKTVTRTAMQWEVCRLFCVRFSSVPSGELLRCIDADLGCRCRCRCGCLIIGTVARDGMGWDGGVNRVAVRSSETIMPGIATAVVKLRNDAHAIRWNIA